MVILVSNILEYKGYYTRVEYSIEDKVLFGKIEGINDVITFECESADEVETVFNETVDDYLALCEAHSKEPDKVYKGSFNVRISPTLHRTIAKKAYTQGISLNQYVEDALEKSIHTTTNTVMIVPTTAANRRKINKTAYDAQSRTVSEDSNLVEASISGLT